MLENGTGVRALLDQAVGEVPAMGILGEAINDLVEVPVDLTIDVVKLSFN